MTPNETMQADNQTVEAPPAPETSQEEQAVSPEAEQLFEAFQSAENETNVKIAKQQDNINSLNEKIRQTEASQSRQFQTVAAVGNVHGAVIVVTKKVASVAVKAVQTGAAVKKR